jgi:hypothetical protein
VSKLKKPRVNYIGDKRKGISILIWCRLCLLSTAQRLASKGNYYSCQSFLSGINNW